MLVACLAALAGCGGTGAPGGSPSPEPTVTATPTPSSSAAGAVDLTIVVQTGGGRQTWKLTCAPPAGTHPDPETACRVLAESGAKALPAVSKDRACTQIYGGPEKATITGSWNGQPVTSTLSRTNGCEISRWNALVGLLPRPGQ